VHFQLGKNKPRKCVCGFYALFTIYYWCPSQPPLMYKATYQPTSGREVVLNISFQKKRVSRLQSNKDWNISMYNVCWLVFVFNKDTHTHLYYICVIYPYRYIHLCVCMYVCACMHVYIYMIVIDSVWVCVCVCIVYSQWNNHPLHKSSTHPHIHQSAVSGTLGQQVKSWLKFDFKNPTVS